jgi:sulfoxide reductase heme-binding subunit YedZ
MRKILANRWTKAAAFCLCLTPVATLVWRAWEQDLSAHPVEFITHATSDWALRFLLITLAVRQHGGFSGCRSSRSSAGC